MMLWLNIRTPLEVPVLGEMGDKNPDKLVNSWGCWYVTQMGCQNLDETWRSGAFLAAVGH